jgi:hypothetical protein
MSRVFNCSQSMPLCNPKITTLALERLGVFFDLAWSTLCFTLRMYHFYALNRAEFLQHYHKRSNVETTFHMIKSKFGQRLRSRTLTAQINEALCKVLCHNLCVVIQSVHELGIEPEFLAA